MAYTLGGPLGAAAKVGPILSGKARWGNISAPLGYRGFKKWAFLEFETSVFCEIYSSRMIRMATNRLQRSPWNAAN